MDKVSAGTSEDGHGEAAAIQVARTAGARTQRSLTARHLLTAIPDRYTLRRRGVTPHTLPLLSRGGGVSELHMATQNCLCGEDETVFFDV